MLRPLNDKVIVEPSIIPDKTPGGIFIPDVAKDRASKGVVVAVGPGKRTNVPPELPTRSPHIRAEEFETMVKRTLDIRVPMAVKVGDVVTFTMYTGSEIKVDGRRMLIMSEDDILAVDEA